MKKLLSALAVMAAVFVTVEPATAGSRDIAAWEQQNGQTIDAVNTTAEVIGGALAPATGGVSALVVKVFGLIVGAFFSINRTIAASRRKTALQEVERNPHTPPLYTQVLSDAAKGEIKKVLRV